MNAITNDETMRDSVERELKWDAQVDAERIAVSAKAGAVILTGQVPTYPDRWHALAAAERVYGVRAVADELDVRLVGTGQRDDGDLAQEVTQMLQASTAIPKSVKADVKNGFVTLHGEVAWSYQRAEAGRAVRYLLGVKGLSNQTTVKPPAPKAADVADRVREAIERTAHLNARSIWVTTTDGTVQLHGHVHSFSERNAAALVAASAPGVTRVENQVSVAP